MGSLEVERIGGLAGFGGPNARIRSHGTLPLSTLSAADRQAIDAVFARGDRPSDATVADGFRYRLTRTTDAGTETVEVPEEDVPQFVRASVKDELR